MTERLLIQASDPDRLADINEYLHDSRFSLSQVAHDETLQSTSIPFHWDAALRQGSLFRRRRQSVSEFVWREGFFRELKVSNVVEVKLDDPAGLVDHSLSRLTYADGTLTLLSNFPGSIQMLVSKFDVQLLEREDD